MAKQIIALLIIASLSIISAACADDPPTAPAPSTPAADETGDGSLSY